MLAEGDAQVSSQADLAEKSGVLPLPGLEFVEGELGGRELATEKIRAAMEIAEIAFNEFNGGGAGVRLGKSCC